MSDFFSFAGKNHNCVTVYNDKPANMILQQQCTQSEGWLEGEIKLHVNIQICVWIDRSWEKCDGL